MSIKATYIVPHPPLIFPEIGNGEETKIQATIDGMRRVASEVAALKPDTIVILSPHSIMYADYIHISPGESAKGDMSRFRAPQVFVETEYDTEFINDLEDMSQQNGISAGTLGERNPELDHATIIPISFINEKYKDYKTVRIAPGGLPYEDLYRFGEIIKQAAEKTGKNVVIIASGDLSHKLSEEGPYGFAAEGPKFDEIICRAVETGDFGLFMEINPSFEEKAADCGLRGFIIMAGTLHKTQVDSELISYEGPFGVGYCVGRIIPQGSEDSRDFLKDHLDRKSSEIKKKRVEEDDYVKLARKTVEELARNHREIKQEENIPDFLTKERAGVFVSIKKDGNLRGCIGTIGPVTENVGKEIIRNAISASSEDPRFSPITEDELDSLSYSVDVLNPPEDISDKSMLDTKKYGVIVRLGMKRGLLLPNLDGVDSVDDQIRIAMEKAGIPSDYKDRIELQRFEVVRHY